MRCAVYTCGAGYYDQQHPDSVTVSQCQQDASWSPVSLRCVFDPAAVARNVQGGFFEYEEDRENIFSVSSIVTIVSISVALILATIIVIVVIKHRRMKNKLLRSRKLSKVTAGGVKVLPDYLFSPTPLEDSQCKVGNI